MSKHAGVLLALLLLLVAPTSARAAQWGSQQYGDPPGFCPQLSPMWYQVSVSNDPNYDPESNTFWGLHRYPGYDNWYGYWYGDFRGLPGDVQPWKLIVHSIYPRHYSWYPSQWGWAFHGHVKQYIAYYNWTFGGHCGMGSYGSANPPPYMADVYGYPVVDIYVDTHPPQVPQPFVSALSPSSVSFQWAPVVDLGDGSGTDYFAVGLDHYTYWYTVAGGAASPKMETTSPATVSVGALRQGQQVCLYVDASDRLGNTSVAGRSCSAALAHPKIGRWPLPKPTPDANPVPHGLTGLASYFWIQPQGSTTIYTSVGEVNYRIVAEPSGVLWNFGVGSSLYLSTPSGFGLAYPAASPVRQTYQTVDASGYLVSASVTYQVYWYATVAGVTQGPYPLGQISGPVGSISYPVAQLQPQLLSNQ